MKLSPEQVEQFRREGYLILPAFFQGEKLAQYKEVFDSLVEQSRSLPEPTGAFSLRLDEDGKPIPGQLHKVQGVCVEDERVLVMARDPELVEAVGSLLGPSLDMFGSKFFPMNLAGVASTGWHQDNHYFGTKSDQIISCAIYLDATDRENGCLQVVPRSHGDAELIEHQRGTGKHAHGDWVDVDGSQVVDVVCPAGTVVLFSASLLHGARANQSGRQSYRTAWHYIPGDLKLEMFPRGGYRDRHVIAE